MSKLGQILKSERESRELLLHEIGMSLKISPKVLQAIEEGDRANLPAKTFLRGFIKSYAQYLRLDPNHILEMFQEEYGTVPAPADPAKPTDSTLVEKPTPVRVDTPLRKPQNEALPVSTTVKALPIIGALILLMLISFVVKMMDKYQKESKVIKVDVPAVSTTLAPSDAAAIAISGDITTTTVLISESTTTTVSSTTTLPSTTTSTTVPKTTTTTSTTTTTVPKTTTTTVAKTTTTTVPKTTTTTSTVPTAAVTPTTLEKKAKPTEIIVEALNNIEIKFTLDGGSAQSLELAPDQVHTFRGKTSVQLEVSDGGAINVIVNGRDRGVPGSIGKPIKLSYP